MAVVMKPEKAEEVFSISGVVKWYDQVRGYGFVVPDNGGDDILLHASCVRSFGASGVRETDRVVLEATQTDRGLQAARLIEIDPSDPPVPAEADFTVAVRPSDIAAAAARHGALYPARVKWFDKHKGFGFVNIYGDPQDVFIHMETVRDGGLLSLQPGEAVLVRTIRGPRGVMVSQISGWNSVNLIDGADDGDNVARLKTSDGQDADPHPSAALDSDFAASEQHKTRAHMNGFSAGEAAE